MLDAVLMDQLTGLFKDLQHCYTFNIVVSPTHPRKGELIDILADVAGCSPNIDLEVHDGPGLEFSISKNGEESRIKFRSTPNGHEFSSLIMAILNCDGKGKNIPNPDMQQRIRAIKGPLHLKTYVNLTCLTCSELVQMINAMTNYNEGISHEIIDGGINKLEVIQLDLQGLPTVFADGQIIQIGRTTLDDFAAKLESKYGTY